MNVAVGLGLLAAMMYVRSWYMSTPEGRVKDSVKKTLTRFGVYYFMPVQTGYGKPGLDFHCILYGKAFCVETKAPGKKLTPRQEITKKEIEASGAPVFVIGERELSVELQTASGWKFSGEPELEVWLLGLTS